MTSTIDKTAREFTPRIGSVIYQDEASIGSALLEGDDYVDSGYAGSDFRMRTCGGIVDSYPVNITVTGRTMQLRGGDWFVRVRIEYIRDCEASEFGGGWMRVDWNS